MVEKLTKETLRNGRITICIAIFTAICGVLAAVWSVSDTATRARQAFAFTSSIHALPKTVEYQGLELGKLDARVCRLEAVATDVAVMSAKIDTMRLQLRSIEGKIERRNGN